MEISSTRIERHKTAIRRGDVSAPIKCGLHDGLIVPGVSVFDFGCGHGEDVGLLNSRDIACDGWDPAFRPDTRPTPADIVNLGYVVNVIENPAEREQTLREAWSLCRTALIVAAQILVPGRGNQQVEFGDGVLTRRHTFQKFFSQAELREYLESVLEVEAIPAAPGIFYLFRDEAKRESLLANRQRRRPSGPRKPMAEVRFEQARELLAPLMELMEELGRLPAHDEFPLASAVAAEFGSLKRAFGVIRKVTGPDRWESAQRRRKEDFLVYLALARFRRRPPFSKLPASLQEDIRQFFGTYKSGCHQADELLVQAGDASAVDHACQISPLGKLLPNALYVHHSAVESLSPLLRVYEGCARSYLGEIEGANVVKLHRFSGKVSYLVYPDFDSDPHPALLRSVKLAMRTQELDCYDYSSISNPPILHRKETFLDPEHPLFEKCARLTRQEENLGLLDESRTIGTKQAWAERLREAGFTLSGHRLIRVKTPS